MNLRKSAEMALEFVEWFGSNDHSIRPKHKAPEIAEALRQALAQPKQEPVLWMMPDGKNVDKWGLQFYGGVIGKPLYTAPPKREWVGLTDEEFMAIAKKYSLSTRVGLEYFKDELEAKLKEKNT